ncbi:AIG2-like protein [Seminavis robusta]|uniref:Putative gamma-glutamylcyclotransferase n=1 Tax=Seminavis robusta TaxID=568900 RepID=A0A9N8DEE5_9STRA|nr:AIG2-like protein [Seminavis robusta]|eukprot:Sro110_g054810.1 AIG2-like protein (168) ;mRNA; f:31395-31898
MKLPRPFSSAQAATALPNSVFVYGSLLSPQVVEVLLGRIPKSIPAPCRLYGYSRHPVKDQVYPAIIPASSTSTSLVDGMIWCDLSDREKSLLDWFEDDEYQRTSVVVETSKELHYYTTDAYIWGNPLSELDLERDWSFENFCQQHLEWYLAHTVRPCREEWDRDQDL